MRTAMGGHACHGARTTAEAITTEAATRPAGEPAGSETREAAQVAAFGASSLLLSLSERGVSNGT